MRAVAGRAGALRAAHRAARAADDSYMDQRIQILSLGQDAHQLFAARPAKEKRSLLNFVLSNSTWAQGKLSVEFRNPFDLLAQTVEAVTRVKGTERAGSARNEVWLPFVDVYRTMHVVPRPSFRMLLEQVTHLGLAA
jgi:hypothetical protein